VDDKFQVKLYVLKTVAQDRPGLWHMLHWQQQSTSEVDHTHIIIIIIIIIVVIIANLIRRPLQVLSGTVQT